MKPAGPLMPVRFDLLTLKLFIAVVEEQSIARAAERENIVPSAVSKRISHLEADLKVSLIQRHNRGIATTPAGNALLRHARSVVRDLGQLEGELAEYSEGLRGQVKVFANATAILRYLPQQLVSFLSHHPLVQIEIEENISPHIVKAVADNLGELGIFGGSVPAPDLHVVPYRQDLLSVVVHKDHPLAGRTAIRFADIVEYDFIGLQSGSSIDRLATQAASELGHPLKLRIRMTGFDAMCHMVEANLGVALVPHSIAEQHARNLDVVELALNEPWAWRSLKLGVRDASALTIAARLLREHLIDPST